MASPDGTAVTPWVLAIPPERPVTLTVPPAAAMVQAGNAVRVAVAEEPHPMVRAAALGRLAGQLGYWLRTARTARACLAHQMRAAGALTTHDDIGRRFALSGSKVGPMLARVPARYPLVDPAEWDATVENLVAVLAEGSALLALDDTVTAERMAAAVEARHGGAATTDVCLVADISKQLLQRADKTPWRDPARRLLYPAPAGEVVVALRVRAASAGSFEPGGGGVAWLRAAEALAAAVDTPQR